MRTVAVVEQGLEAFLESERQRIAAEREARRVAKRPARRLAVAVAKPVRAPKPDKKRERARARTARRRAKDCALIAGIETLRADPCAYCGSDNPTTHDHIEPVSRGGAHALSNLARCCWRCNREKGVKSLLVYLATRAARRH